jgi:signal peptidase II
MKNFSDFLMWPFVSLLTVLLIVVLYPFYVIRNLGYHLRAPSVLLYAGFFFLIDRATKMLVHANVSHLPIVIWPGFFDITYVRNPGVAFGWFPDWRLPPILMAVVMIVIISYYSFQLPAKEKLTRWSLALLVGGAVGNLYDRLTFGYVIDFFLFHLGPIDFPVFNVADVAIDVGVFLLFLDIFLMGTDEETDEMTPAPTQA